MNYILKSSLEQIAVVKLAAILWNQQDIRSKIFEIFEKERIESEILKKRRQIFVKEIEWLEIEDKVKQKVPQIPLPEILKEKTLNFIKPVGLQILNWIEYNHKINLHQVLLPLEFSWTSHGTLDKKRTAEFLIKDETIDIRVRHKLACIYCIENDVRNLRTKINENCRENFYNVVYQEELGIFWAYNIQTTLIRISQKNKRLFIENALKRDVNYKCSLYLSAFENAVDNGNTVAIEYFYDKLTISEREESLFPTAVFVANNWVKFDEQVPNFMKGSYTDVLCFLLSKMSYEQQLEIFEKIPTFVLLRLLDYPWQVIFMETVSMMWSSLSGEAYVVILNQIMHRILDGHKYFNFQEMLRKYWQQSPDTLKRPAFRGKISFSHNKFFINLFKSRDENSIKMIFRDATLEEKKIILYSFIGQDIFIDLIDTEEWGLLEYFIRECVSSKDEMIEFKKSFVKYGIKNLLKDKYVKNKGSRRKCVQLLDKIINGFDKRKCAEENDVNKAKKLCIS